MFSSITDICADQSNRWRLGERVLIEHYLAQFPALLADPQALLELIQREVALRTETGESPNLRQYLERFPQYADLLRGFWSQSDTTLTRVQLNHPVLREIGTAKQTIGDGSRSSEFSLSLPGIELFEKLGEGGMGVVYRARDLRLDQPRAIKVIRAGPFAGKDAQDRFNREARAVARLNHPGVVRIHSLGEHHETLYICMEYVDGGSLQALLEKGPMAIRRAAELVRDMALAVHHAHVNRVLHRDLKPANVILTNEGRPKISDFGLAKLLDTDEELTQTGAVMGTPAYMAPEQADGRMADLDERTDVWSLGAILYECLTGAPPFKGVDRNETMELVRKHAPASIQKLRQDAPAPLEAVCLQCLEKRVDRRYPTALDLANDLQSYLDGKPTRAGRVALARGWRRRQVLVGGILLAAVAAAAILHFREAPPRDETIKPTGDPPLEPDKWHPLLAKHPARLQWPAGATMEFKELEQELHISSCPGLGLNVLGETNASRYRLRAAISQTPVVGNIGIFFGYHDESVGSEHRHIFQVLELTSMPNAINANREIHLVWKNCKLIGDSTGRVGSHVSHMTKQSGVLPVVPGVNTLEFTVGPSGLEAVHWQKLSLAELCSEDKPPSSQWHGTGKFGIYTNNGSGVFKNAEYLFNTER